MPSITIKRCPICPKIVSRAKEIADGMNNDLSMPVRIEDGAKGEFTILMDGRRLLDKAGDELPTVHDVEAAMLNAAPAGV